MFSGIVEEAATVVALKNDKGNLHLTLSCSFTDELRSTKVWHIMEYVLLW